MTDRKALSPQQRRQRNRNEVIAAIVAAARETMRQNGVAALNLTEIARALGMQTPSLYEYFPNKLALYDYLFRLGLRDLQARLTPLTAPEILPAWGEVERLLTSYVEWSIENPDFFKLLFERHIPGFTPSDESMAEMYVSVEEGQRRLEALLAANLDPGIPLQQAFDVFLVVQHGITALHLANSPDLPVGQGRFTILNFVGGQYDENRVAAAAAANRGELIMAQPTVQAPAVLTAAAIPKLARHEVIPLARVELDRFLALIETLTPAELNQPTDCALWSVKDIIAHQASHVVSFVRLGEFIDQFNPLNMRAYIAKGMNLLDAANQRQVDLRAAHLLAQLVTEIRGSLEQSLDGRQRFPAPLRWLTIPVPGSDLRVGIGDLMDTIYTRDMWMHRADICRATGRTMPHTPDHDGRIVALIVRELDAHLRHKLDGRSVTLQLTGMADSSWILGSTTGGVAEARLTMDTLEFNRLASGRITAQRALDEGLVELAGDQALGTLMLNNTVVLY